ncbi:disintegrin and metalloproteinase domain-containing protein 9 [Alosa alosa]|uniref:disintegrin and metalloproteinase domain-containing protein 9 n=1 Tax=Alosa alosa TaxID=278164 RepID=UPI0020154282|nr:disintegrin and metalloproteinase domain-containing protein 9 [Alosa alosa]
MHHPGKPRPLLPVPHLGNTKPCHWTDARDREMAALLYLYLICVLGTEIKGLLEAQSSKSQEHTVVIPKLLQERVKRHEHREKHLPEERHSERLVYSLRIGDRDRTLLLEKNRDFLSADFVEYSHGLRGKVDQRTPMNHVDCHYHGYVEGDEDSLVALSTCAGLRGVIHVDDQSYGLRPVTESGSGEHFLFDLDRAGSEPFVCGVSNTTGHTDPNGPHQPSLSTLLRRKRNLPQTRYVELVLVIDKQRYDFKKQNMTAVREEAVQLANLLDGYYKRLNVRVVLVGLWVFEQGNPFSVDGTAGDVLGRFVTWRRTVLLPTKRHDVGQLIVGRGTPYPNGVLGMAFVGTVCSVHNAGGINVFRDSNTAGFSTVLAHELGHNLGMGHDSTGCSCDGTSSCIMAAAAGGAAQFSDCSGDDFERLVLGGGVCLMNQPPPSDVVSVAVCGNGVLEKGEECDCGTPEECKSRCCDALTCRLTSGSVCAEGACCQDCQYKVAGSQCRRSENQCDLPEFCNGSYAFCPGNFYLMDGLHCDNARAFCYEGRCQTYDYQCKHLFGPEATKADDRCFSHVNTRGNEFGNCGFSGSKLTPCAVQNVMCGKIQCTGFDSNNPPKGVIISIETLDKGVVCKNAHHNLGTDVLDPAYVNQGSVCAPGKACLSFKCVNDSALIQDTTCTARSVCAGAGVCNNKGHCHCNDGWAPPRCDRGGRGGSVDSGPAQIDHSLRNGLLIFFLLVVPLLVLLVLALLYVFRRDTLEPCLRRVHSKPNRPNDAPSQANGNPQRSTSPQAPTQLAPTNPQPFPPYVSESAVSYDPWQSGEDAGSAAAPPPRQQGPGAPHPSPQTPIVTSPPPPRPIPPKHL